MNRLLHYLVIDRWHEMWCRYSVRLAAATATLATLLIANQNLALSLLAYLPEKSFTRLLCAICIGVVVFVVPTLTVLWKQNSVAPPK